MSAKLYSLDSWFLQCVNPAKYLISSMKDFEVQNEEIGRKEPKNIALSNLKRMYFGHCF